MMPPRTPIQVLQSAWKRIAPLELADSAWDNVGVMIEAPFPRQQGKKALLTIDLTTAVCDEAINMPDCSLIVSYHPPIFSGLKSLTLSNPLQSSLLKLSAKGISVFTPHTSLDAVEGGINSFLSSPFIPHSSSHHPCQLKYPSPPSLPKSLDPKHSNAGMGMFVTLKDGEEMSLEKVVGEVKGLLGLKYVQVARPTGKEIRSSTAQYERDSLPGSTHLSSSIDQSSQPSDNTGESSAQIKKIKTLAFCAGSGSSVFKGVDADVYVTGEMSHHEILPIVAANKSLILTNHTNNERPYLRAVLKDWLQKELNAEDGEDGWEVIVSEVDRDPLEVL